MNKVQIIGRCTKDPDVRYASATQMAIAKFNVAVDDGYGEKKKTYFIPVIAFGKTAENCERFLGKGCRVAVEGKIATDSYENQDGRKVYTTDVIADRVEFIDFKDSAPRVDTPKADENPFDDFAALSEQCPF